MLWRAISGSAGISGFAQRVAQRLQLIQRLRVQLQLPCAAAGDFGR